MNKNIIIKIITLALSLCLMLSLLAACNGGKDTSSSTTSSDSSSPDQTGDVGDDNEPEDSESEDDGESPDQYDNIGDDDDDDDGYEIPIIDNDDEEEEEEYFEELRIFNGKAPIITNYRGVSASVYHLSTFMKDRYGRNYTDEMAKIELDRLQDAGIRFARTYFRSAWMWDNSTNSYNWNSSRINDFYRCAKELQDRGINIILTIGWHFDKPIAEDQHTQGINEVPYLYGKLDGVDNVNGIYGELKGYDTSGMSAKDKRLAETGLRFGEWAKQAILECRKRGINNVSHILTFVEPSYRTSEKLEGPYAEEYITTVKALKHAFRKDGTMNTVKIVGPNQGSVNDGEGLLRYTLEKEPDLFDVWTAHFYPQATESTDDVYEDICTDVFGSYMDVVKRYKRASTQTNNRTEFWVDEFYARSSKVALGKPSAWNGLQTSVGVLTAMKLGIQNISLWQIFDQLWIDQNNTGGEFVNGIHAVGSAPSLFVSSIPRPQYYPVSMLGRSLGYENGKVYEVGVPTEYPSGLHMGAVQLKDGTWTIVVINCNFEDTTFRITLDSPLNQTLFRHVYNTSTHVPTTAARLPDFDKVYKNVQKVLKDTIPGGSVAVYTSQKF